MQVHVKDPAGRGGALCGAYRGAHDNAALWRLGKFRADLDDPEISCARCLSEIERLSNPGTALRLEHAIVAHQNAIESAGPIKVRREYALVAERKHAADRRLWSHEGCASICSKPTEPSTRRGRFRDAWRVLRGLAPLGDKSPL